MNFRDLMVRADDEVLQSIVGTKVLRLLRYLDPELTTPSKIRKLILDLWSPYHLLSRPDVRELLSDLLPPAEASRLAMNLAGFASGDVYQVLKRVSRERTARVHREFCNLLGVVQQQGGSCEREPGASVEDVSPAYSLFYHQRKAVCALQRIFQTSDKRALLHMPTGAGKTRTAMNLVCDVIRQQEPSLVVWLAYNEELCEQAAEEFLRAWRSTGNRSVQLMRFWGQHSSTVEECRDGLLVMGLSKTYLQAMKDISFLARVGDHSQLVVFDEAHQAVAETYKLVLEGLLSRNLKTSLLGLSATPGRTWNNIDEDEKLAAFFCHQKVGLSIDGYVNPMEYLIDEGFLARPKFIPLACEDGIELTDEDQEELAESLDIPVSILQRLAEDAQRNLLILLRVEQLLERHKRVLVFATTVEHSELLAAVLRARGVHAASVTGKTDKTERRALLDRFRGNTDDTMVLTNYGVLTTGFDAPRTSCALIARPTKSLVLYSQMIGRVIRGVRCGGNEDAEIVTVVDRCLPGFGSVCEAFHNWEDVWS